MSIYKITESVKKVSLPVDMQNVSSETARQSLEKITSRGREQLLINPGTDIKLILVKIDAGKAVL